MAPGPKPPRPTPAECEQALRYGVVCAVISRTTGGQPLVTAIAAVSAMPHVLLDGSQRYVSRRSIYRWLSAYEAEGMAGLASAPRPRLRTSKVLYIIPCGSQFPVRRGGGIGGGGGRSG